MMMMMMHRIKLSIVLLIFAAAAASSAAAAAVAAAKSGDSFDENEVCYGDLGCFRNDGNFFNIPYRPISYLPQSPQQIDVTFQLFTQRNFASPQYLIYNNRNALTNSNFRGDRLTKLVVFGYTQTPNHDWVARIRRALLKYADFNVIIVDWSRGNQSPYTQAVANARVAGAVTGRMIKWLSSQTNSDLSNFHLIGHSLGSHLGGYAGAYLQGKLGQITALDPAGPYFEFMHPEVRLDETDARFVDVIHTDGNSTLNIVTQDTGYGLMQPLGHVDFYPNGGRTQPNCVEKCHHHRSYQLMIASIENPGRAYNSVPCDSYANFLAKKCSCGFVGCASMGIHANRWNSLGRKNVKMFVDTTGYYPFEL